MSIRFWHSIHAMAMWPCIWQLTPPDVNIQSLAQAHKLNYRLCVSAAEVRESLTSSWRGESKTSAHTTKLSPPSIAAEAPSK